MSDWLDYILSWIETNEVVVAWTTTGSAIFIVFTLLLVPWLIVKIPADYFSNPGRYRSALFGNHPAAMVTTKIIRNLTGLWLITLGILLLLLPGQGLLTIVLGVAVSDFPGKHRLVNWLVQKKSIYHSMNWLRRKAGKEEIQLTLPP